ncbi:calcium-binding protein [Dankookia sp. P2]|uniref:calcium-binding protein n=1 Tax=Dankookia sp. P2 TaxID=3423955 RepID=UPI003D67BDCA
MPVATDPRLTAVTTPPSDLSTTGTNLDWIVDTLAVDAGLAASIPGSQIATGLHAADRMNRLIAEGVATLHLLEDGRIDVGDVLALNGWIRGDADRLALFTALHGDDDGTVETGFHLVKGDGAVALAFHHALADTVADGIYHVGFAIQDGRFLNEDGNPNAAAQTVADQLDYYFADLSTTGTGLDAIIDIARADPGLSRLTLAPNLQAGLVAADRLNHLILDGLAATHGAEDGRIDAADVLAVNAWIRGDADRLALFTELHGDDADGVETGFHLIKGDGGTSSYLGLNLVDQLADSLYHIGSAVEDNRFLNEDGNPNATLGEVATSLNHLLLCTADWEGTDGADVINVNEALSVVHAGAGADSIHGGSGADTILGEAGDDYADGGAGDDNLDGGAGDDLLFGGAGRDTLAGGEGWNRLFGGEGDDLDPWRRRRRHAARRGWQRHHRCRRRQRRRQWRRGP